MPRRFPYRQDPQDQYEYCPWCLKRSCRGTCMNGLDWLHVPEEKKKPKAQPLRLDKEGVEWLEGKRRKENA